MSKIIGIRPELNEDQRQIVDLLKETLAQALEGSFHSIGIVVCMKAGYSHVMAGRQAADLNLGCDSLKAAILHSVENAGSMAAARIARAAQQPVIIQPRKN